MALCICFSLLASTYSIVAIGIYHCCWASMCSRIVQLSQVLQGRDASMFMSHVNGQSVLLVSTKLIDICLNINWTWLCACYKEVLQKTGCDLRNVVLMSVLPGEFVVADKHTDQLAQLNRIKFCLVYTSHMVQAIYQALQSSASLGSCFWINPSGTCCCMRSIHQDN